MIHRLRKNLQADWKPELEKHNILTYTLPLYNCYEPEDANGILAYLVLAYHNDSEMLELHKDRHENKRNIFEAVFGQGSLQEEKYKKTFESRDSLDQEEAKRDVLKWILEYQKDWRWRAVYTCFEFYSKAMEFVQSITMDDDPKKAEQKSKFIELGIARQKQGQDLLKDMKTDYVKVDEILDKEKKPKLTDQINSSWEDFMRLRTEA